MNGKGKQNESMATTFACERTATEPQGNGALNLLVLLFSFQVSKNSSTTTTTTTTQSMRKRGVQTKKKQAGRRSVGLVLFVCCCRWVFFFVRRRPTSPRTVRFVSLRFDAAIRFAAADFPQVNPRRRLSSNQRVLIGYRSRRRVSPTWRSPWNTIP